MAFSFTRVLLIAGALSWSGSAVFAQIDRDAVLQAMADSDRLESDVARDSRSLPESVIPLLDIEPGDRVVDLFAGGGYYSELLARVLGADGEVLLHNSPGFESWGRNGLDERFANERDSPGNIVLHTRSGINLMLQDESVDAALIVMALHDLYVIPKRYNGSEYVVAGRAANVAYFYSQVYAALKPGGRFVVVDHQGNPESSLEIMTDLHRIDEAFLRSEIESRGFNFVGSTQVLRNPEDDKDRIVFDEDLRGRTDRFVMAFEKIAGVKVERGY